jgi:hypothetical protein
MPTVEEQIDTLTQAQDALAAQIAELRELIAQGVTTQALSVSGEARFGNDVITEGALKVGGEIRGTLAPNSVGANQLADGAVVADKILNGAVGLDKIANKAVAIANLTDEAAKGIITNRIKEIQSLNTRITALEGSDMQMFSQSFVFGSQSSSNAGHTDHTITPPGATRVLGGWWSLQEDASEDAFKQFSIGAPSGISLPPAISGHSITFRVTKKNNNPGLFRVLFTVLYVK